MLLLAECVSIETVARSISAACYCSQSALAKSLPNLRQPYDVTHRVHLSQTIAQSMSAVSCHSECISAKPLPDLCQPHDVARRVHVSAKPLPDPCQPYKVARRVRLSQTVAQSMLAT